MAGMLFVVCVPTAEFEYELVHGSPPPGGRAGGRGGVGRGTAPAPPLLTLEGPGAPVRGRDVPADAVPMERVLEGLLKKLKIEHVVWCSDKNNKYFQVFFPVESGDATENCLHSLTQVKIGRKHNSVVSVVPCNVFMQGLEGVEELEEVDPADKKAWDNFVDSVRAKLTVKQVVDGVRCGAEITFDYVTLILTADMVAAMGLIESSAVNIVAAMLISPLMGPVMALTFGTAIADRSLQWVGVKGVLCGGLISLVFGFILGLLVGSTDNPWGFGNWPTDEMQSRGNVRSLWIGVLWALPSGTGVALALMQGMAGPLIGVAISASLLPPIVNCGILWGLTCTKLIYGDKMKIPHFLGESFNQASVQYKPLYSSFLPYELVTMGIISFCLTLVNIICIFITAMIVLKIKEVAAPYTSSPDLRRFWEHDIPLTRDTNRMSMRQQRGKNVHVASPSSRHVEYSSIPQEEMETLEVAMREAMDDDVFRRVNRCSYAHTASDLTAALSGSRPGSVYGGGVGASVGLGGGAGGSGQPPLDPALLDQLISSLLGVQAAQQHGGQPASPEQVAAGLSRFRPLSRSMRPGSVRRVGSLRRGGAGGGAGSGPGPGSASVSVSGSGAAAGSPESARAGEPHAAHGAHGGLPTIDERSLQSVSLLVEQEAEQRPRSLTERAASGVRAVMNAALGVTSPAEGSIRFSRRGSETTSLM